MDNERTDLDWQHIRHRMVAEQIEARGIRDPLVLEAIRRVERHRFVPRSILREAYEDMPLPIGDGQTISQPFMVALMTSSLMLKGGEKVLEVGTGSGYQAAVLSEMGCVVHTIERQPHLAAEAARRLKDLGYDGVFVHEGDGTLGLPEEAPFQAIVVTAGGPRVPESLKHQLDPEGGVLSIPVGGQTFQNLFRVIRRGDAYEEEDLGGCRFVPLLGQEGWPV
jgi:protein-L-isoaspartate(D-aspartate) O-methyltransferase